MEAYAKAFRLEVKRRLNKERSEELASECTSNKTSRKELLECWYRQAEREYRAATHAARRRSRSVA